tara:strand:+ start:117 stop:428 length:312 start_codon:yes stop_codon:yes gene_type:complete
MVPLGLQMTTVGSLGGPGMMGDPGKAATRPDPLWECTGIGDLQPLDSSAMPATDNNDMWDFISSPFEYTPEDDSTNESEGFWEVAGTNLIQPIEKSIIEVSCG